MGASRSVLKVLATLGAGCALAACTDGDGHDPDPDDPVAQHFAGRSDFASCGTVELPQGEVTVPRDAAECVESRVGGPAGAELTVSVLTTEGDPILHHFRAGPGVDGIELYVDHSRDQFGDQPWEYCATVETVELFAACAGST